MIPEAFLSDALLFPPPDEQLEATAECPVCPWRGTRFVWPVVARIGVGEARMETPVGHERLACPDCGVPLDPKRRHPSHPDSP